MVINTSDRYAIITGKKNKQKKKLYLNPLIFCFDLNLQKFHQPIFFSFAILLVYLGSKSFVVKSERNNHAGRILILEVKIDNADYILILF